MTAVILAGGRSSRFGRDKLAHDVGLLSALAGAILPQFAVILVGPPRPLGVRQEREALLSGRLRWVADEEPDGGPASGLLTGIRVALSQQSDEPVVVLPGDAPGGAGAVPGLITALSSGASASCPRHGDRLLPLPCALSPTAVRALVDAWAGRSAAGVSVRALLAPLEPVGVDLPALALFDIDTPEDLARWRSQSDDPGTGTLASPP